MKNTLPIVKVNIDKKNNTPIAEVKQFDDVVISLEFFKDNVPFNLTGQTTTLYALRPNRTIVEQSDGITINSNTMVINLRPSCIALSGITDLDISLTDSNGTMTTASVSLFVTKSNSSIENFNVESEITGLNELKNQFREDCASALSKFDTDSNKEIEEFNTDGIKAIKNIKDTYEKLETVMLDKNQGANLQKQIYTKANESDLEIERKRIDSLTKLGEGSTTGDAELIDGRIGADGVVYDNIGDNIRNIAKGNGIKDNSIAPIKTDFIGYVDLMNRENIVIGAINSSGTINSSITGNNTSDFIPVDENTDIYLPGKIKYLAYYNINKKSLVNSLGRLSNLNNYKGRIPVSTDKVKYIRITWANNDTSEYYREPSDIKIYKTDSIKFTKPLEDKSIPLSSIDYTFKDDYDNNIYFSWNSVVKTLCIYMKSSETNTYLGYRLRKMSASYDSSNSSSNYDIWRLRGIGLYTRNSDNTFNDILPDGLVHEASEWECAIKETGLSDFTGGSTHGDEFIDSIVFMLDGKIYNSYNDFIDKTCKEFRVIRKSKLYRANENSETYIADHYVDYLFKNNEVTIDNRIDWKVDTNCGISYLCMLGAKRFNGTTQITNRGLKQGDGAILDVSKEGHSNNSTTKRCTKAYLWNDGSNGGANVSMSVEILENNFFPNFNFKFDNRAEYNKFYFDQCGQNFDVKQGDIWFNKALYKIDYYGMY